MMKDSDLLSVERRRELGRARRVLFGMGGLIVVGVVIGSLGGGSSGGGRRTGPPPEEWRQAFLACAEERRIEQTLHLWHHEAPGSREGRRPREE